MERGKRERRAAGITGGGEDRAGEAEAPLSREREEGGEGGNREGGSKRDLPPFPLFGVSSCRRRLYREGGREDSAAFMRLPNRESEVRVLYGARPASALIDFSMP